ncbi:MAG: beta-propeller domain-containing protein [Pirellulaceae bacterium]|nr:beta-propeller domain-containing protein [Pirellulaceae bacterium]
MIRPKKIRRRTLRLEQLEVRLNFSMIASDFQFTNGPVDDAEVVRIDSTENNLSILANDRFGYRDFWPGDPTIDLVLPAIAVGIDFGAPSKANFIDRPEIFSPDKILSVTTPKHGQVRIADDRLSVFYSPDAGFAGVDQFDYRVEGNVPSENSATVSVNVVQPLLAVDDWFLSKPTDASLSLDVLENDQFNASAFSNDEARQKFKIVVVTNPSSGGSANISGDGRSLVYSAATGFEGIEKFEYTFEDQDGYRDQAEVSIRVSQSTTAAETVWPEQLRQEWLDEIVQRNLYQFGLGVNQWGFYPRPYMRTESTAGSPLAAPNNMTGDTNALTSSHTNNQVAGVDEGDIVETDGRYLYVFSHAFNAYPAIDIGIGIPTVLDQFAPNVESSELVIIDAIDPTAPKIVSQFHFAGRLVAQHLSVNRLVVLSESYDAGRKTSVAIVDIADRAAPKIVRSSVIDGSFRQSRMIGDKFYLFTSTYLQLPSVNPVEAENGVALFYESGRQFFERLGADLFEESLIQVTNFDDAGKIVGNSINTLGIQDALDIIRGTGTALGIYSFDIDASQVGPFDIDTLASGYAPTIFVSSGAAYFFDSRWDLGEAIWGSTQVKSYAFDATDGSVALAAAGNIAGSLLNSFSVGEHNGDLQVFTAVGDTGSQLTILRRDGQELKEIGSVKNIAPGEQIYSARLDGDRAYAVTFRRVDPLFVFDLSDPTSPKIEGELKLPGYSQYLHVIDATHLMGIGRDADERNGLYGSLQVSLFDVSDLKNPTLKSKHQFDGGRRTFSPLLESAFGLSDHQALGYFEESGVLALPLKHYPDWRNQSYDNGIVKDDSLPEVGVLRIDTLTGIADLGGVQSSVPIQRTVRMGEYLYSIASDRIIVTDLLTPSVRHAELLLPEAKPVVKTDQTNGQGNSVSTGTTEPGSLGKTDGTSNNGTAKRLWHNRDNPCDVNGDGTVAPLDVLNVINFLRSRGSGSVAAIEKLMPSIQTAEGLSVEKAFDVDVNDDGEISPIDVLIVINRLRRDAGNQGEGEADIDGAAISSPANSTDSSDDGSILDFESIERKRKR